MEKDADAGMDFSGGPIAVTGASGHVGAALIRSLIERRREVRALVHSNRRALDGLAIDQVCGDLLDTRSLRTAFDGIDVVYHLAASISVSNSDMDLVRRVNVEGTRNVVQACRACGVRRLVCFSSISALSPVPFDRPVDEHRSLVDGGLHYARTKAEAERVVLSAVDDGLDAVILNPTAVIGPFDFAPSYLGQTLVFICRNNASVLVNGGFNWVDVRDVANGAIQAESRGATGQRYILSGTWLSLKDVLEEVDRVLGRQTRRLIAPTWLAHMGVPLFSFFSAIHRKPPIYTHEVLSTLRHHKMVSCEKATRELGYCPRPFQETIRDTIDWFGEQGHLERHE